MGAPQPPFPGLQCEKCGAAVAPGSTSCPGCGAPVAVPAPAPAITPAMPPAPSAVSPPEPEKASIWVLVKLLVVPLAAALVTALEERNAPPGRGIGFWIGLMVIPTLIAFVVVRFKPAKKIRTFSTVFFLVGFMGIGSMLISHMQELGAGPQKTPKEIAQEAAGVKPVTESGSPSQRKVDGLMREFMADLLAARKKHDAAAAPLEPVLSTLYTAESFSSRKQMEDTISAVKQVLVVDQEMMDKFLRLPQEMKARVDASELSSSDKADFMRGFQQGYGSLEIITDYRDLRSTEEQWSAATVDLYTFALEHASAIKIKDKRIVIANEDLLTQFNAKFDDSRALQQKIVEGNKRLAAHQSETMQKTGISKSDLGLK